MCLGKELLSNALLNDQDVCLRVKGSKTNLLSLLKNFDL